MPTLRWSKQKGVIDVLTKSMGVSELVNHARSLAQLEQVVLDHIDPSFHLQINVARYEAGQLVLLSRTAAFAVRLRYLERSLIAGLKRHSCFRKLKKIHLKVQPDKLIPEPEKRRLSPLSRKSATLVQSVANDTDDLDLKASLERLAKHHL